MLTCVLSFAKALQCRCTANICSHDWKRKHANGRKQYLRKVTVPRSRKGARECIVAQDKVGELHQHPCHQCCLNVTIKLFTPNQVMANIVTDVFAVAAAAVMTRGLARV